MAGTPPRLAPTMALALAWAAVYVLWLAVRPDEARTTAKPGGVVPTAATTTTTALKLKP